MGIRGIHRLSASFVRHIAAPGQYRDGDGLLLRVTGAGTKQWVQRLRMRGFSLLIEPAGERLLFGGDLCVPLSGLDLVQVPEMGRVLLTDCAGDGLPAPLVEAPHVPLSFSDECLELELREKVGRICDDTPSFADPLGLHPVFVESSEGAGDEVDAC